MFVQRHLQVLLETKQPMEAACTCATAVEVAFAQMIAIMFALGLTFYFVLPFLNFPHDLNESNMYRTNDEVGRLNS